jgi:hypothetical protein
MKGFIKAANDQGGTLDLQAGYAEKSPLLQAGRSFSPSG